IKIRGVDSNLGHRNRVREEILNLDLVNISDYKILEFILFLAKPRGDTKPLAKKLIANYGSLAKVLNAPPELLLKEKDVGKSTIATFKILKETAYRLIKSDMDTKPIIESWKSLLDYARASMGHSKTEQFRILYLD